MDAGPSETAHEPRPSPAFPKHRPFVRCRDLSHFLKLEKLGEGTFGFVVVVTCRPDDRYWHRSVEWLNGKMFID
jgi:hypothetical protein